MEKLGDEDFDNIGGGGGGDGTRNYFKIVTARLQKDICALTNAARKVMRVQDPGKAVAIDDTQDDEWSQVENTLFNEADKIAQMEIGANEQEKIALIAKLMNMRERMQTQVFQGVLYKKLITWKDLKIDPDEWASPAEVDILKSFTTLEEDLGYLPT